jgi:hypothetical protein
MMILTSSGESALGEAESRKCALTVALAANTSGLLGHLERHLQALSHQLREACDVSRGGAQQVQGDTQIKEEVSTDV